MAEAIIPVLFLLAGVAIGIYLQRTFARGGDAHAGAGSDELRDELQQARADVVAAREDKVRAETERQNLQEKFEQEKKRLAEIRAEMENAFKAMATDIASANTRNFLERAAEQFKNINAQSEQELDHRKKTIDTTLNNMNQRLEKIHEQSVELKTKLDENSKSTQFLSEQTQQLREVLSSSQKRGQWGERMVIDILQVIGMLEGKNYTRQAQTESGTRPDFTFLLPREKKLNMDVKFPLDNYVRYLDAEDGGGEEAKRDFLRDVKNHIKTVCGRDYINPAEGTLEYVMLFIPNESIYGFINSEDTELVDYALKNRVLLCSPLTLYAVLSLMHQATRNFVMNERAAEVMSLVGKFRAQWEKYTEQMGKLGRRINDLHGDYETLTQTRTRALQRPLDKIEDLSHSAVFDADTGKLPPPDA